jgi:hypothetical protein
VIKWNQKFKNSTGGFMVALRIMNDCINGNCEKCPGHISAPPGVFGGVICQCTCHRKKAFDQQKKKGIYFPSKKPHTP